MTRRQWFFAALWALACLIIPLLFFRWING